MRWIAPAVGVAVLGGLALVWEEIRQPAATLDRGPAGIDFVIPSDYRVLELGESTPAAAATELLRGLGSNENMAAVFTHSGDRIQLLVDRTADAIEERVMGGHGTVRRVIWPDSASVRLRWARDHGEFAAPGLPDAESRNPYH